MEGSKPPLPVDHGWAWWIMVGYFLNFFIIVCWIRSLAILLPVFLSTYEQSTAVTTLAFGIGEIAEGVTHLLLPLCVHRIKVRYFTLIGGVARISAILSLCISPNTVLLNAAFALLGFGRGIITNPQVYLLGNYFKKRHSLASSVAHSGISLGTLVSPFLTQLLLDTYDIRGTYLVFAGIAMHSIIAAMLFRPVSMYNTNSVLDTQKTQKDQTDDRDKITTEIKPWTSKESIHSTGSKSMCDEMDNNATRKLEHSGLLLKQEHGNSNENSKNTSTENIATEEGKQSISLKSCLEKYSKERRDRTTLETERREHRRCINCKRTDAFSTLTNPTSLFIILAGVLGTHTLASNMYMPVLGLENGLSRFQLPWLLTVSGISDIIGKFFFGCVADRGFLRPINIACLTQLIVGILFQFVSFYKGIVPMLICCTLLGLNAGMILALIPPIANEFIGVNSLPLVTSVYFIGSCLVTFFTHLVVGSIKDITGSFTGGYNFVGALMLASVVLLMLAQWSSRYQVVNSKEESNV